MEALLAASLTLAGTLVLIPLSVAWREINQHDRQVGERDETVEEWIVTHDRELCRRLDELAQNATAHGVAAGGSQAAGSIASRTLLLYEYREELREARNFVLVIGADEWAPHSLVRLLRCRPFPSLVRGPRFV